MLALKPPILQYLAKSPFSICNYKQWTALTTQFYLMQENYILSAPPTNHPKRQSASPLRRRQRPSSPDAIPQLFSRQNILRLNGEQLIKAVQTHGWRAKTSLPILRTISYEVSPLVLSHDKKRTFRSEPFMYGKPNMPFNENYTNTKIIEYVRQHPEVSEYQLTAQIEEVRCRLSEIKMLPFSQIMYLLKQALIGFEVLVDLFGIFQPTEEMLAVNVWDHWKMWISGDYSQKSKIQANIAQNEFLYKLLLICERHCTPSSQSKIFFSMLKESCYSNDCTFIRIIEKTHEFASVNKVYQVSKVSLATDRMHKNNINAHEADRAATINNHLRRFPTVYNAKAKSSNPIGPPPSSFKPITNCADPNSNRLFSQSTKIVKPTAIVIPSDPQIKAEDKTEEGKFKSADYYRQLKNLHTKRLNQYQQPFPNQKGTENIHSCTASNRMAHPSQNYTHHNSIAHPAMQNNSLSNHKVHAATMTSPPKHRQQIKQIYKEHHKTGSKLQESPRKYSEPIVKMKSVDALINKNKQQQYANIEDQPPSINLLKTNSRRTENAEPSPHPLPSPVKKTSHEPEEIQCDSSPNNSSSTKELHISRQMKVRQKQKTNYANLKMNDLAGNRLKYNQSVINCYAKVEEQPSKDKNMAVSYQFPNRGQHQNTLNSQTSEGKKQRTEQSKWKNKISGLFSDNVSIKHLKESVRIKTNEEDLFEKEYLKDIKLDMLQKFGRKVNHLVVEEEDTYHSQTQLNSHKYAQYKSMQLIEEELQEVKSYLEEDLKNDDIVSKSIRSRHQTVQTVKTNLQKEKIQNLPLLTKERPASEFDDDDADSEIEDNGGFDFQSEDYVIQRNKQ